MGLRNATELFAKINGKPVGHTTSVLYSDKGVIIAGLYDESDEQHELDKECEVTICDSKRNDTAIFRKSFEKGRVLFDAECENTFQYTIYFGKDELLERQSQKIDIKNRYNVHKEVIEELSKIAGNISMIKQCVFGVTIGVLIGVIITLFM